MGLEIENSANIRVIQGHDAASVSIGSTLCSTSFLVSPSFAPQAWPVASFGLLSVEQLQALFDLSWEVLIIGTGTTQQFPGSELLEVLATEGRGVEFMNSRSACTSYNLLAIDQRSVVGAIILPLKGAAPSASNG
jgi:uncharacterized protein